MQEVNVDHQMKSEAHDIEVSLQFFPLGPLHPPVPSHIPNFIQILPSRLPFTLVDHPVKIKKKKLHKIPN